MLAKGRHVLDKALLAASPTQSIADPPSSHWRQTPRAALSAWRKDHPLSPMRTGHASSLNHTQATHAGGDYRIGMHCQLGTCKHSKPSQCSRLWRTTFSSRSFNLKPAPRARSQKSGMLKCQVSRPALLASSSAAALASALQQPTFHDSTSMTRWPDMSRPWLQPRLPAQMPKPRRRNLRRLPGAASK